MIANYNSQGGTSLCPPIHPRSYPTEAPNPRPFTLNTCFTIAIDNDDSTGYYVARGNVLAYGQMGMKSVRATTNHPSFLIEPERSTPAFFPPPQLFVPDFPP
jgi:hypothetical protein